VSLGSGDLGVLGNLAKALGIFDAGGSPNQGWLADPGASLKTMLASPAQRAALIAFVDDALGGADRSTEAGVTWLPVVEIKDPPLLVAVTVDEAAPDGTLHLGLGLRVRTTAPSSSTTLSVPLFRASKQGGPGVGEPLLLGSTGGRIRIGTSVTVDGAPPVPGQARLGAIGLDVALPTSPSDPEDPVFGLSLTGLQLPGAASTRDVRVAADGAGALDDAVLDLVLSLVKAQADAVAATTPIGALGGLLGLRSGDAVPDFPIADLRTRGPIAIADWVRGILSNAASRNDWLTHHASLLQGSRVGDAVQFSLGGSATLRLALAVDTGPSGHAQLTPTLSLQLGNATARVEARAELLRIDLVTGAAVALPSFGVWAAAGDAGSRVLDVAAPTVARADTLRIGFGIDAARRLNVVLAADNVTLGAHTYPTLDLTSPDAVMDAAGNTVADVANQLLSGLGPSLGLVRPLIGLDPPAGITAITLPALMTDPAAAVGGYWQQLVASAPAATAVLGTLQGAIADASEAGSGIRGSGSETDPWRMALIGPLQLEVSAIASVVRVGIGAETSVDTLGQRCTVVQTRLSAQLARIDLAARSASLMTGVEATLSARERGVNPPRARFALGDGVEISAAQVGLRLAWSPAAGFGATVSVPDLSLSTGGIALPIVLPVVAPDGSVTLPADAWDGVEALVGHLGALIGGFVGDTVRALGWSPEIAQAGGDSVTGAHLRLADLVASPAAALADWLPRLAMSELGEEALGVLADLFAGSGALRGVVQGRGDPDDPKALALGAGLPELAVWFPPQGLEPASVAAPQALQQWRPGDAALPPQGLAAALAAEATVDPSLRDLIDGRDIATGLVAIAQRWLGGDGRIVPPAVVPPGIAVRRTGLAASQLVGQLDLQDLIGRVPTTTVFVGLGPSAWPDAPAGRRIDLTAAGLDATMFAVPAAATGDWFVALGTRADCRTPGSTTDGTPEQAARLARVLAALASAASDIALVAVAGAGHAARVAAQRPELTAVTDLVLLGTPLAPISLTALSVQPTADALRLLYRLMPGEDGEDDDALALGRGLVEALMQLAPLADPGADLRPAAAPVDPPRAGLAVTALFGTASASQIGEAITAIVAAGLAERARARVTTTVPPPTGVRAGLRWTMPPGTDGTVAARAVAVLQGFAYDTAGGVSTSRVLRVRMRIADRLGWLASTAELELRALSIDLSIPLDGASAGTGGIGVGKGWGLG
jgi:large repetitive protein